MLGSDDNHVLFRSQEQETGSDWARVGRVVSLFDRDDTLEPLLPKRGCMLRRFVSADS